VQFGFDLGLGEGRAIYLSDEERKTQFEAYVGSATGEHRRLSDDSSTAAAGNVTAFAAGANDVVVYTSDRILDERFTVDSVRLDGRPEFRTLTDPLVAPNNDFPLLALTPDGRNSVHALRLESGTVKLYVRRTDGTSPPVLVAPHLPTQLETTADSTRYVYQHDTQVYSGPIDGSHPPVRISAALASTRFVLTPDSTAAVFQASPNSAGVFRAPLEGSAPPVSITGALPAFSSVSEWRLTPDGTTLLYRADVLSDDQEELFSAPLDGSTPPVRLNAPLLVGRDVVSMRSTPDSSRVVYISANLGGDRSVHSVPTDGSQVALDLTIGSPRRAKLPLTLSPDSRRVVFLSEARTFGTTELFSVLLDGSSPPVVLNEPFTQNDVLPISSEDAAYVDPASNYVVFRAPTSSGSSGFHVAPIDGTAPARLLVDNLTASTLSRQSPDRAWIVYERSRGLFVIPTDGSRGPRRLDTPLGVNGSVRSGSFVFTPDSRRVLYLANQDRALTQELYQSPLEWLWRR
jgi:hypothetical protein